MAGDFFKKQSENESQVYEVTRFQQEIHYWPIPKEELIMNENFVQNQGWENK
ncbi:MULTISPECIES: RagB/SusD family nutrient uptake outer membrane protein [Parabacteroides]|uniref:RagB/SusD family nutrient uptake outer membrane protein n=1 Tax=Parabacteroides leei TaxID=2939491 RepID=UPI001896B5BE|nr:RagB/SusD family nutrient uptake outer membrane protein [Parabacteroides goldsteinii]